MHSLALCLLSLSLAALSLAQHDAPAPHRQRHLRSLRDRSPDPGDFSPWISDDAALVDDDEGAGLSDRDLGLALPDAALAVGELVRRQSVGTGGVGVGTGNISAGVGDITLDVGNITIQTGNLTLEDIVLGNIVVIVDVGVGSSNSSDTGSGSSSSTSAGATAAGNEDATVQTITGPGGEEEGVEIETVYSDHSTFYTYSTEPDPTTIAQVSATDIVIDDDAVVEPTIRKAARALVTPAPAPVPVLDERALSISPSVSVGGVSASVGAIGASVGNINVTVGDVLVGLGDITLKNITIGNVFVSVNIQANLKRSDDPGYSPTGITARAIVPTPPPPTATATATETGLAANVKGRRVMEAVEVGGRREIRA